MNVLGYDPLLDDDTVKLRGAQPVPVDELYLQSDVITLHLPLTNDTRGLLDAAVFAKMKAGVFLVCAARGGVIDEDALLAALNSGQVAGAALDVYATEPPGASDLVVHPHVVATPHIGGQTAEAQVRAARDVAEEVLLALNDQPLRWRVV
jgi:phosphoglycerate dehydrogenase-like enzyme